MASIRNAVLVMMAFCIGLQIVACNSLALSGDKRYKTEVNNVLLNAQADFDKNGAISEATQKKMTALLTKYEAEYSGKGSYMKLKDMVTAIDEAEADPANAFKKYQAALAMKHEAENFLTTEFQ